MSKKNKAPWPWFIFFLISLSYYIHPPLLFGEVATTFFLLLFVFRNPSLVFIKCFPLFCGQGKKIPWGARKNNLLLVQSGGKKIPAIRNLRFFFNSVIWLFFSSMWSGYPPMLARPRPIEAHHLEETFEWDSISISCSLDGISFFFLVINKKKPKHKGKS